MLTLYRRMRITAYEVPAFPEELQNHPTERVGQSACHGGHISLNDPTVSSSDSLSCSNREAQETFVSYEGQLSDPRLG